MKWGVNLLNVREKRIGGDIFSLLNSDYDHEQ